MDDEQLHKDEDRIIEYVKEWLLNDPVVVNHLNDRVKFWFADPYQIDLNNMTPLQEEFICQCQVAQMSTILGKVIGS